MSGPSTLEGSARPMTRTPEQQWQAMAEEARMGTLSRRRIAVLLEEGFEDLEFWVTVMRLREEQADVTVIGTQAARQYHGKHGLEASSDVAAKEVSGDDFEAVVVPGG